MRPGRTAGEAEPMRALDSHTQGYAINPVDGVRIFYEEFGPSNAERTIVFLVPWTIVNSRIWKAQVPYFARHGFRVITFDARGNGQSDRPDSGYCTDDLARDTLSVLDVAHVRTAALVALSSSGRWAIQVAAEHPQRVTHLAIVDPAVRLSGAGGGPGGVDLEMFHAQPIGSEGLRNKFNANYWRRNYREFLEYFFSQVTNDPHSTKQIEDSVGWGLGTTPEILIATIDESATPRIAEHARAVRCPVLFVHGTNDALVPVAASEALQAVMPGSQLVRFDGTGHGLVGRKPVRFNLLLHEFLGDARPCASPTRNGGARQTRRALFVSSPIGLGHAWRDVAIADALRQLVPNLEIEWLAQDPVTRVLETRGERIHPMSAALANESRHIESECGEHDLHAFQAYRRMDEILVANFLVFHDAVKDSRYDLWIADEGWEIDYFLHEHPNLKTAPYAWLTDFVGWLPMRSNEEWLTADYNAQMLEHVDQHPDVRDRALLVGNAGDVVPDSFGEGLPGIREWTSVHYSFSGYIQHFDPRRISEQRDALRGALGFDKNDQVVVVSVGGTSVGRTLLQRVLDSYAEVRRRLPSLRMLVITGPRIDPASLAHADEVDVRGYVPDLYKYLAACDLAVVQGGLSTTMELVATGRPFLYVPLRNHFEQNFHVPYRLHNYGVRPEVRIDFAAATPERLAEHIVQGLTQAPEYRPVETGGASNAARLIAELL
jgi:pimeloyl-ACP methyl ester carboxylesterase/predicted glycosyltransferase